MVSRLKDDDVVSFDETGVNSDSVVVSDSMTGADASDDELRAAGLAPPSGAEGRIAGFYDFMRWMLRKGALVNDIKAAARRGWAGLDSLRLHLILFGPGQLDLAGLEERSGVDQDDLGRWWPALGLGRLAGDGALLDESDVTIGLGARVMTYVLDEHAEDVMRVAGLASRQFATAWLDGFRVTTQAPLFDIPDVDFSAAVEQLLVMKPQLDQFIYTLFWRQFCEVLLHHTAVHDGAGTTAIDRTIVFVDVVDFTRLSQRVDGPELGRMVRALERLAVHAAQEHDGRIVKTLGDGVMLEFADATAGVRAALLLVEPSADLPPRRAGVASGDVVSRQADYFGPVVNLTARLASVAEPNEVAVDRRPNGIICEEMDPVLLKGYDEPITPFRVRSKTPRSPR